MQAYRDQYARVFKNGQNVVLMGMASDPVEELASWAHDDDFQFLMGSDPSGSVFQAFGGVPRDNGMPGARTVIVVDPQGRVSHVMPSFNQVDPAAYDELQAAIEAVTPEPGM